MSVHTISPKIAREKPAAAIRALSSLGWPRESPSPLSRRRTIEARPLSRARAQCSGGTALQPYTRSQQASASPTYDNGRSSTLPRTFHCHPSASLALFLSRSALTAHASLRGEAREPLSCAAMGASLRRARRHCDATPILTHGFGLFFFV